MPLRCMRGAARVMHGTGKIRIHCKENGEKRGGLMGKAEKIGPLADTLLPGGCRVEVTGNRRAVVEGSAGILEYAEETVCVHAGRYTVRFSGRSLQIRALSPTYVVIEGFFTGIEYI